MHYLVCANNNKKMILDDEIIGYSFMPKKSASKVIKVKEVMVVKKTFIEKIMERKIKLRIDKYLAIFLNEEASEDDTRYALDEMSKFKAVVNFKYRPYLKDRYLKILNKKIDMLEQKYEEKIYTMVAEAEIEKEEELETRRSR